MQGFEKRICGYISNPGLVFKENLGPRVGVFTSRKDSQPGSPSISRLYNLEQHARLAETKFAITRDHLD